MATADPVKTSSTEAPDTREKEGHLGGQPPLTLPWNLYNTRVLDDMRNLFQKETLTDVMVAADGQSIACHKVLLAAASGFFFDKFVTNQESLDHNLLEVEDIDFETLRSVVVFIYKGGIELTVENVKRVFLASGKLRIPELTDKCEKYLLEELDNSPEISVETHRIAKQVGLKDLQEKCWKVMLDKFQTIAASESFKEMTESEIQEYISDGKVNVPNEDPVFQSLVSWVNHDPGTRKPQFEFLLRNIQLSRCSLEFLRESVCNEPLMESGLCYKLLSQELLQRTSSPYASLDSGAPRKQPAVNTLLFLGDKCHLLKNGKWEDTADLTVPAGIEYSACLVDNRVLVIGGRSGNTTYGTCYVFCLDTLKWNKIVEIGNARCTHSSIYLNDQVYIFGGYNHNIRDQQRLSSVECLKETGGTWHVTGLSDMPESLSRHTSVSYQQTIYAFGGYRSQSSMSSANLKSTFAYNTITHKWESKAEMPYYCLRGTSVVVGDKIYVLGGEGNVCMSYVPDQDKWNVLSSPRVNHRDSSAVVWNNRILLCGGAETSVIEEYNPVTDTWAVWEHELPQAMECYAVFALRM